MIQFRQDSIRNVRKFDGPEFDAMLAGHYDELTLNKDRVKLKPRWDTYEAMEDAGAFTILTARDPARFGQLVGYNAFFVNRHMHYEDLVVAMNDVFYLHPDYRTGANALRFLRFTENHFKDRAHKLAYHFKATNNFGPLLLNKRLGYSPEEGVAAKLL